MNILTVVFIAILCAHLHSPFPTVSGYFWRESIAWRNDYAEQTSYYVYFDFVGADYPALLAELHSSEEPSYDVDFDVDVEANGLPLEYLIAMRIYYANSLERMRLWKSDTFDTSLLPITAPVATNRHRRTLQPFALSLANERQALDLVRHRFQGFIDDDWRDTNTLDRAMEKRVCAVMVSALTNLSIALGGEASGVHLAPGGEDTTTTATTATAPATTSASAFVSVPASTSVLASASPAAAALPARTPTTMAVELFPGIPDDRHHRALQSSLLRYLADNSHLFIATGQVPPVAVTAAGVTAMKAATGAAVGAAAADAPLRTASSSAEPPSASSATGNVRIIEEVTIANPDIPHHNQTNDGSYHRIDNDTVVLRVFETNYPLAPPLLPAPGDGHYVLRGLLAAPLLVDVTPFADAFARLTIGGFKSVKLFYCSGSGGYASVSASAPVSMPASASVPVSASASVPESVSQCQPVVDNLFSKYHRVMVAALAFSPLQRLRVEGPRREDGDEWEGVQEGGSGVHAVTDGESGQGKGKKVKRRSTTEAHSEGGAGGGGARESMLFLGVGGGELISYLQAHHPYLAMVAVDMDAVVVGLARRWFGYDDEEVAVEAEGGGDANVGSEKDKPHGHGTEEFIAGNGNNNGSGSGNGNGNGNGNGAGDGIGNGNGNGNDNDNGSSDSGSQTTTQASSRVRTVISDAWSFLRAETSRSVVYDYVLCDLYTADVNRPDTNDTNVQGLSHPFNMAALAAVTHPRHGIAVVHLHRNDRLPAYLRLVRAHFPLVRLMRSSGSEVIIGAHFDPVEWVGLGVGGVAGISQRVGDRARQAHGEVTVGGEILATPAATSAVPGAATASGTATTGARAASSSPGLSSEEVAQAEATQAEAEVPQTAVVQTEAAARRWRAWRDPCADPLATAALLVHHGGWHGHHPQMTLGDRFAVDCVSDGKREVEGAAEEN